MTINFTPASTSHSQKVREFYSDRTAVMVDLKRFPANTAPNELMYSYVDDFDFNDITAWTVTTVEAGAGSATEVFGGPGGVLTLKNAADAADSDEIQKELHTVNLTAAKNLYFQTRIKLDAAATTQMVAGLVVIDTSVLASAPTDGIYFSTATTDADLLATTRASSTGAGVSSGVDAVDDTWVKLGILFKGTSLFYYIDDVHVSTQTSNIPAAGAVLVPTFGELNGAGTTNSMSIDYYTIHQER